MPAASASDDPRPGAPSASSRPYDVITVADFCVDLVLTGDVVPRFGQAEQLLDGYLLELGGSTCLFAAQAARLGLRVAVVGESGDDAFGRFARDRLAATGVDCRRLTVVPGRKTGVGVALTTPDDRAILTYAGTAEGIDAAALDDDLLRSARHLHIGSYFLMRRLRCGVADLIARARRHGLTVSLDSNWDPDERWDGVRALLPAVDLFLPNRNELEAVFGMAAPLALEAAAALCPCVAVKCGEDGAWLRRGDAAITCRGRPVPAVDGIGAGDAFDAGLVYGLMQGWDDAAALRAACACGAASVRAPGGLDGQLTGAELDRWIIREAWAVAEAAAERLCVPLTEEDAQLRAESDPGQQEW